jgi:pimeloyl-ACP methyl ester carboxylesterase
VLGICSARSSKREATGRGRHLPAGDPYAGADRYADVVADTCHNAGPAVVVGHSLGGLTIPLVASRRPVTRLVFLSAAVPEIGATWAERGRRAGGRRGPERTLDELGRLQYRPEIAREAFYHDCRPELADEAMRHLRPQAMRPFTEVPPLQEWPEVPSSSIHGRDDRLLALEFARQVATEQLGTVTLELDGGHSLFMSRPAEVAEVIVSITDND